MFSVAAVASAASAENGGRFALALVARPNARDPSGGQTRIPPRRAARSGSDSRGFVTAGVRDDTCVAVCSAFFRICSERASTRADFFGRSASARGARTRGEGPSEAGGAFRPTSAASLPSSAAGPRHGGTSAWNVVPTRMTAGLAPPAPAPKRPMAPPHALPSQALGLAALPPPRAPRRGCMRTAATHTRKRSRSALCSSWCSPCGNAVV